MYFRFLLSFVFHLLLLISGVLGRRHNPYPSNSSCVRNLSVEDQRLLLSWDSPEKVSSEGSNSIALYTVQYMIDSPQNEFKEWNPVEGCTNLTRKTCLFQPPQIWQKFLLSVQTNLNNEIWNCHSLYISVNPMDFRLLPTPQFHVITVTNKLVVYPRAVHAEQGKSNMRALSHNMELNYQVQFNETVTRKDIGSSVFEIPAEKCGELTSATKCCIRLRIVDETWKSLRSQPFSESNWSAWQCVDVKKETATETQAILLAVVVGIVSFCAVLVACIVTYRLCKLYREVYKKFPKIPQSLIITMRDVEAPSNRMDLYDVIKEEKFDPIPEHCFSLPTKLVSDTGSELSRDTTTSGIEVSGVMGSEVVETQPTTTSSAPEPLKASPTYVTMAMAIAHKQLRSGPGEIDSFDLESFSGHSLVPSLVGRQENSSNSTDPVESWEEQEEWEKKQDEEEEWEKEQDGEEEGQVDSGFSLWNSGSSSSAVNLIFTDPSIFPSFKVKEGQNDSLLSNNESVCDVKLRFVQSSESECSEIDCYLTPVESDVNNTNVCDVDELSDNVSYVPSEIFAKPNRLMTQT